MWGDNSILIWALIVPAVLFVFALFWSIFSNRTMRSEWRALSRELGMNLFLPTSFWDVFLGKMPTMTGSIDGFGFFCTMMQRSEGRDTFTYTQIAFEVNKGQGKTVSIYIEDVFAKMGKVLGGQDVQFDDPDFDDRFMIKSNDEQFALAVFDRPVRDLILARLPLRGELKLEDNVLLYEEVWTVKYDEDSKRLLEIVRVLLDIAKEIND